MMTDQLFMAFLYLLTSIKDWLQYFIKFKAEVIVASSAVIGRSRTQILNSLIFGSQQPLTNSLHRNFQIMGMLHLLSASGYNVGLVLQSVRLLLKRLSYLSQKTKAILTALSVLFFFYLSNGGYSLQRAVLMALFSIVIRRLRYHQISSIRSLAYACFLIIVWQPASLDSLSLQLSIAATWGIVWLQPVLTRWFAKNNNTRKHGSSSKISIFKSYCRQGLVLYLAAQIGVLPILVNTFGEISLLGLITNTFLTGLVPLLTLIAVVWFGYISIFLLMDRLNLVVLGFIQPALSVVVSSSLDSFLHLSDWLGQASGWLWAVNNRPFSLVVVWYLSWLLVGFYYRKKWVRNDRYKYQLIQKISTVK
jgi:competence protein ComEC